MPWSRPRQSDSPAVVFDFDGVLVDSEAAHGRALAVAGESLGLCAPEGSPDWYIGLGDDECFQRMAGAVGRRLDADDLAALRVRKAESFAALCAAGDVAAFPGALELLRAAAATGRIAVCSGSRRRDIEPVLESLGVLELLSTLVSADDVMRTKPDPAPYLLTAQRLGMLPERCVAIEDSPSGVASAKAAGYRRVHAVCHTFSAQRLADAHLHHPCIADLTLEQLLA